MNKITKIVLAGLMTCASVSLAGITTTFTGHTSDTTLRNLATITLDYTIDGAGNVTLDASTSNGGAIPTQIPDFWDGAAGTVSEASLWGTSFSLTGTSTGSGGGYIASQGPNTGLGIQGGPSNTRIDDSGAEAITWTYAGFGVLNFTGLGFADRVANGASKWLLEDSDTSVVTPIKENGNVVVDGTINLNGAGYSLASGDSFTISSVLNTPTAVDGAGASLAGLSFEVIPEPATLGLVGVFGGAVLFIRRRFMI